MPAQSRLAVTYCCFYMPILVYPDLADVGVLLSWRGLVAVGAFRRIVDRPASFVPHHRTLDESALACHSHCHWRSGDFVDRPVIRSVGGFPDIPLMEDVALSKVLRRAWTPRLSVASGSDLEPTLGRKTVSREQCKNVVSASRIRAGR